MSFLDNTGVQNLVNDLKGKTDAAYQEKLESGTNIKTVNGNSLLGNGDLEISGGAQTTWWGTSSTTASTAAKVVTCEGFTLTAGAIISILFGAGNEAAVPTLNVNSTGNISIRIGDSAPSWSNNTLKWSVGSVLTFVYDGTYFRYLGAKTAGTYAQPEGAGSWYGTSSTAATYAAKVCVVSTFRKTQGARVSITFSTANTYINGALTLNIDSTGASTIYVNNVATSASNTLLWDAGETLTFVYSGQYYYFVGRSKASGGGSVTVDSALSSTSENPVQNKVINTALGTKQDTLVSGTNIKTINNQSLLGSGNISISGGSSEWIDISDAFEDGQGSSVGIYAITDGKFVYFSYDNTVDGASPDVHGFTITDDRYLCEHSTAGAGLGSDSNPLVGFVHSSNATGDITTYSPNSAPVIFLTLIYPIVTT